MRDTFTLKEEMGFPSVGSDKFFIMPAGGRVLVKTTGIVQKLI